MSCEYVLTIDGTQTAGSFELEYALEKFDLPYSGKFGWIRRLLNQPLHRDVLLETFEYFTDIDVSGKELDVEDGSRPLISSRRIRCEESTIVKNGANRILIKHKHSK